MRWFNTAGPCKSDIHYLLSSQSRLPEIVNLIAQQGYFVIHAPRQTGKTTAMLTLALAAGANLREAMELAQAAASVVVHQLGTTGTASVEQLRSRLGMVFFKPET